MQLLSNWFKKIGHFPGTLRVTSTFNSGRNNWKTLFSLGKYLEFMMGVSNHSRLVFADEKSLKGRDIYGRVRRDVLTGSTPCHRMSFSAKNRLNILATVTVKGRSILPVEYFMLDKVRTNSQIFVRFVCRLLQVRYGK